MQVKAVQRRIKLEHEAEKLEQETEKREQEMLLLAAFLQVPVSFLNKAEELGGVMLGDEASIRDAIESGLVAMFKAGLPKPTGPLGAVLEQLQDAAETD